MAAHELFAYLCVSDAARAIDFYRQAFGATEKFRLVEPGGRIGHAEVDFDGTILMLCEEFPELGIRKPDPAQGHSTTLHLHVDDTDRWYDRAIAAGASSVIAPDNMFWGDRYAQVRDPFGHLWSIGHPLKGD